MVNSITTTMMNVRFALVAHPGTTVPFLRALLPIPGLMPVDVMVAGDESSCVALGARMFSVSAGDVDLSMMEDTLRELANITAGQVKRAMALDSALGLPTIIDGALPWRDASSGQQAIVLRADVEDIHLEVQITTRSGELLSIAG